MLNKLKKQSLSKILIMEWNILRVMWLYISKGNKCKISVLQNIHPSSVIAIEKGEMTLAHSVFTRRNVCFRASGGELIIGTSFFNQNCSVTAKKSIRIGDNCLFGPNVVIVDHDHDYMCSDEQRGVEYLCKDVFIGNNVVVGANTVILKGTVIGDNCMIGAGCVISGCYEAGTLIYDKRNVNAKVIEFRD